MYDVAIVGGGFAGLTAASYLARAGRAVALFERGATLGGRARTTDHAGFRFNRGAHALYTGGAASDVLRELGVVYQAGGRQRVFGLDQGRLGPLPTGPAALLTTRLLDPADKLQLFRVLLRLPRSNAHALGRTTIAEWIVQTATRPRVQRMLAAIARGFVYSAALDLVSADVFVEKLQRSLQHPVHYVDGGWQTLIEGLARAAVLAGARLETAATVDALAVEGDRVTGVRVDGQLVEAEAVVLAIAPAELSRLIQKRGHASLRAVLDGLVPAHVACLDVALERLPNPCHPVVFDLDLPRLVTAQSVYARVAPRGAALLHAMKWLDPRHLGDWASDERDLEDLLDSTQPAWRDLVVKRLAMPRITAVGALPLAARGGLAGRPSVAVRGVDGLYLAGDWVGSEGFLVDASAASARQAARIILQPDAERDAVNERRLLVAR